MRRKREYLGQLELMVLLAVVRPGAEVYGVEISKYIAEASGREVSLASVYAALERLEQKGFVQASLGEPTGERGGRARTYFRPTPAGLTEAREACGTLGRLSGGTFGLERESCVTRKSPHRLSIWLLSVFADEYRRDSLIGDLLEQSEARGRWWYWRQVTAALARNARDLPRRSAALLWNALRAALFDAASSQEKPSMKFLPLLWASLWRKRARTLLTLFSIVVAFLIVGVMSGINTQFNARINAVRADRIIVSARFGSALPVSYVEQIERIPGVARACPTAGHGGTYQSPTNGIGILMTHACALEVTPEFAITPQQFRELEATRDGVIISRKTAERLHWEVGKTYPLETLVLNRSGTKVWTFTVIRIAPDNDTYFGGYALGNYAYLDEGRADGLQGQVTNGPILVRVADPSRVQAVSSSIEKLFLNSGASVNASPARARLANQLRTFLDIRFDTSAITFAALFMVLFLTANVMAQSASERIPEFATMKALGMTDRLVFVLVLCESVVPYVVGAAAGLALSLASPVLTTRLIGGNSQVIGVGFLTPLITPAVIASSLALALGVAVLSGLPAAWRLQRLTVAEALTVH